LTPEQADIFSQSVGQIEAMNGGMNWYRANLPSFERLHHVRRWPKHNRKIKVPALIIWGEKDQTFLPIFLDLMPATAADLSTVRLVDVGHMTPIEKSDESMTAIMVFLAEKAVAGD
jgi:pimeloyl-ACP methyl ester carboxylesterase